MTELRKKYLVKHGIRPSLQRMAIMDYLLDHHTHPTVDEIYTAISPRIPTLSRTTVYNTLKLFVSQGVALYISIDDRNARFDGVIDKHAHFRCKDCGRIIDIPLSGREELFTELQGMIVDYTSINIKGLCKLCAKQKRLSQAQPILKY
ncbi:MAG: transcriptional repressor [Tannerella sp.]|jgi:Fur family peroxide stress response transcriptional regulator|nr:transcriptional repressor [Tannerella sp.]